MFRKLVSNLSFSPALIHEVGFYAHRLRKEETTRQLATVFIILALIVQSLAVFSPPESANASSNQDLIRGGVSSKQDFLGRYDSNEANIKDIYTTAGITRNEIENAKPSIVNTKENVLVMGRQPQFGASEGEVSFSYTKSDTGQVGTTYMAPFHLWNTNSGSKSRGIEYQAWIGQSAKLGWFAILKSCANLATKTLPSGSVNNDATIKETISAINLTQNNVAADTIQAQPDDRISFTIKVQNTGQTTQPIPLAVPMADTLEYSELIDNGGGDLDSKTKTLSWPPVSLGATLSQERTFVVQLLNPIPATATGQSNSTSYDCVISNSFGTMTTIQVACPIAKTIEASTSLLPATGVIVNVIFASVVTGGGIYFYFRTKQLRKEIRLIRHTLNTGAL